MHLALELGRTVAELEDVMTEREFTLWQIYRATHMLPTRRIEMALANITSWIAKTMGGIDKHAPLQSFLVELEPIRVAGAEPVVTAGAVFGGFNSAGMHVLGQGRKLKKVK